MDDLYYTIKQRRGFSYEWTDENPVLGPSEIGVEKDTGLFKIGDGFKTWDLLDYFLPAQSVKAAIAAAIEELTPGGASEAITKAINDHVNAAYPHTVYDDGPSLLAIYKNAKV